MDPNFDPALTRPLSPSDFQVDTTVARPVSIGQPLGLPGDASLGAGSMADDGLDPSDLLALQTAQNLLRDARARAASPDRQVAKAARWDIVQIVSFLAGLADARGWVSPTPPHAGFTGLTGETATPAFNDLLDHLDASIGAALSPPQTRRPNTKKFWWTGVGDAIVGVSTSLIAAGVVAVIQPA